MRMRWLIGFILFIFLFGGSVSAHKPQKPLTLEESIKIALERNLKLHSAIEGVAGLIQAKGSNDRLAADGSPAKDLQGKKVVDTTKNMVNRYTNTLHFLPFLSCMINTSL